MLRILLPGLVVSIAGSAIAAAAVPGPIAQPDPFWRSTARACAEAIGEQGGHWPEWARCTIEQIWGQSIPVAQVDQCIDQVQRLRMITQACNNCGDPVKSTLECLGLDEQ